MELATGPDFPILGAQKWGRLLADAGIEGVRIRAMRPGDEPQIVKRGTDRSPIYRVVGILTSGDKLVLKGGVFTSRDIGRLKAYLETLRTEGEAGVTDKPGAFGISTKQLIAVTRDLEKPVEAATQGKAPATTIAAIAGKLEHRLSLDAPAAEALQNATTCLDEVKGISSGTAIAALLRPFGLILRPYKAPGGEIELLITTAAPNSEAWPVGWPPENSDRKVLPALFEFINVEIEGIELTAALEALEGRLKVPFLFDHNALARERIEPAKVQVSIPPGRSYYKKIIERVLFHARLKGELRVDERGQPLMWITTVKA